MTMTSRQQSGGEARRLRDLVEKAKQLGRAGNKGPEAIRLNTRILHLDPKQVCAYIRRGICYLAAEDFDAAKKDFEEALALEPNNCFAITSLNEIKERSAGKKGREHERPSKDVQRGRGRNTSHGAALASRRKRLMESLPKQPIWVYHFTPVENLPGILASSGIVCSNRCRTQQVSIAHQRIQNRRSRKQVTRGPGGNLHDYVPFYFAPRSPMMFAINGGAVATYNRGQGDLIYLVLELQSVAKAGLRFVFTDRHAVTEYAVFYDEPADLDRIDWDLMASERWNNVSYYPDRKDRRQAEFLVHGHVPWGLVDSLAVMTPRSKRLVENLLGQFPSAMQKPVRVEPGWYF